jgi:hydrogenase maturation protein HypF
LAWDGTGFGDDRTIWGGEAFLVREDGMNRIASLYPFSLPGGEKAITEPRRAMLGLFHAMFGNEIPLSYEGWLHESFTKEELAILAVALKKKVNTPICSSIGRLFDAVSALLGFCRVSDFEGQAALLLETAAYQATTNGSGYPMPLLKEDNLVLLDWRPMIKQILNDKIQGIPAAEIAMAFHETLAQGIVALAKIAGEEKVLLTGGVMQNKLLVEKAVEYLKAGGFKPYIQRDIPPNDGGIAVGQLIGKLYQNHAMEKKYVSSITG